MNEWNCVYHTAVIGAGASGLMCAGSFGADKILIDHNKTPGVKLSVSGGGKCNFSNRSVSAKNYLSQNKHFCKNALAAYKNTDFLRLLEQNRIPWTENANGQFFARRAKDVLDLLVRRAKEANTRFLLDTQALAVERADGLFRVRTSRGVIKAGRVVLACGGLSFPALGASNFGIKTARAFGLNIIEQRPALAGLTLPRAWRARSAALAGNSLLVHIKTGKFEYEGPLLFTHDGVSGPAVLQTSLFWREGEKVTVNFMPGKNAGELLRSRKNANKPFSALLSDVIPAKVTKTLLGEADQNAANAPAQALRLAEETLNRFTFVPAGTGGLTKAEVTSGGVDVREINPSTLECRRAPGLYVTGELLDVTGMLGGYNLQWAWSSGFAAAKALEKAF